MTFGGVGWGVLKGMRTSSLAKGPFALLLWSVEVLLLGMEAGWGTGSSVLITAVSEAKLCRYLSFCIFLTSSH